MIKNKKSQILFTIFIMLFMIGIYNISQAASFGSVDGIDEGKYPGFKSRLKELQKTYPNITVLYTGLDWNTVIHNEHEAVHGRNLVSTSMGNEWICQECKKSGKWYDSGLYCASEEAVRYVMDARNYLNTKDIFQFQKLDKDIGTTTNEISIVLQMQQANYLKNDKDAIKAFVDTAKENHLNAYHLVTRVIQEQGRSGTSTLSSGLGYTGNGYQNYGYGFYNLFSIEASRKNSDPAYMIYINALDKAAIEGWNTRAASIRGGGKFVGNNYINVGQNTLYLQKFAVYNTKGQLYWHQYMQNLFGAQNEAKILYSLYQATGIQNNRNFEFVVPVYENMPSQDSRMPGALYDGYMTSSQFGNIGKNGSKITGKLVVQEWLKDANGFNSIQAEPTMNPRILLKADDGSYINCDVTYVEPYVYQYSVDINQLNVIKEYYLEVQCANNNNISSHTVVTRVPHKNQELGQIDGYETYMLNNVFTFRYNGVVNSYPYKELIVNQNKNRIEGQIVVQEWLNGTKQMQPKVNPYVFLVAEDGTKIQCEVGYIEPYIYGFSCRNEYIDQSKKYTIKVEAGIWKNISPQREKNISYSDMTVGMVGIYTVKMKNNKLSFEYDGYMNSYPHNQEIVLNGNKISGNLIVQEWLNGTKQIEPSTLPKLVIKNASNREVGQVTLKYKAPYIYGYEIDVGTLTRGTYTIEIQGTNPNNISTHQKIGISYNNQEIGQINSDRIKIQNGKLIKEEKNDKYDGYMNSYPYNQNIVLNGNKIRGSLVVQEWLNGTKQIEPSTLPKLVIKNASNREVAQVTLECVAPYVYSYEIEVGTLARGTYTIEVQGTNPNNISTHQKIGISYNNQEIGQINSDRIKIENGKLIKEGKNEKYDGYINSYPYNQNIVLNGNKISGSLVVQEWLNGTKQIEPVTLPRLVVKNDSNKIVMQVEMKYVQPYIYDYEIDLTSLGKGNYTLEVQGTNPNNISNHQNIVIKYPNQEIKNQTIRIENGKLIYQTDKRLINEIQLEQEKEEIEEQMNDIVSKPIEEKIETEQLVEDSQDIKDEENEQKEN